MLRSERPRVRDDEPPPRMKERGEIATLVRSMARGSWVMVTHSRAKSIARVVHQFGGQCTRWRTSELFSCVKVLEAPWMAAADN